MRRIVARPRSTAAASTSLRLTSKPALAQAIAMPAPIVPAPTTATARGSAAAASRGSPGTRETPRSAKNAWTSARPCSERTLASDSSRSRRQPSAKGSEAAASSASSTASGASWLRRVRRAVSRPCCRIAARSAVAAGATSRSRLFGCGAPRRTASRAKATAAGARSPSTTASTRPDRRASSASIGRPDTHISTAFCRANQPRQPLRAFGSRHDPQVDLGQAEAGGRAGDTVVPRHRELEPAAERRAVDRHHHRLRAVLDERQELVEVRRLGAGPGRRLEVLEVGARDERLARPEHHERLDRRVRRKPPHGRGQLGGHVPAERVDRRIVDPDDGDRALLRNADSIGHVSKPAR